MTKNSERRRLGLATQIRLFILVALLMLLASCGDDSASAPTTSAAPTQSTAAGTTPNAAGSSTVDMNAWNAVVAEAKREGSLTIYTVSLPTTNDAVLALFKQSYPDINVTFVRAGSQELEQRIDAERKSNGAGADLYIGVTAAWFKDRAATEGFLLPASGPNVAALPKDTVKDTGKTVPLTGTVASYIYNTNAIKTEVKVADFIDPKYKGKIALPDFAGNPTFTALFAYYEDTYGEAFIKGLAANQPTFYNAAQPISQAVASGEKQLGLYAPPASVIKDSPVKVGFPEKPMAIPLYGAVVGGTAHQNAAQVMLDFLATRPAQEIFAAGGVSVVPGVASALYTFDKVVAPNPSNADPAWVDQKIKHYNTIFGR